MQPGARHKLENLLQSALLLAAMGALSWFSIEAIAGPETALWAMLGVMGGLALAPGAPMRLLLRAYGARPLTRREAPDLAALVEELARRAELPSAPKLFRIPSALPNAFAMGRPEDSVVCVTDGLLRLLTPRELAAVLAHEVSHVAHRDLWIMGLADSMSRAVALVAQLGQIMILLNLPLLLTGAATIPWRAPLVMIFAPVAVSLLQLALSRTREFDADLGAARLTGDPLALASALEKLERGVGRMWEDMFLGGRRVPEPSLLRTHPPTEERIARLREVAREMRASALDLPAGLVPPPLAPPPPPPRRRWTGLYY
ncbi:zinc metalloprotease HtpX [Oceanicella actignis]|uniref:zinc metalloprotease HtpX n=1 Tax=Oceanicella actignis TaxID=1189325 RepID=UPI0011E7F03F|nr:zinc metalloprotease HtpX [Oceanicella actignis]TYO88792.1 heat shock protein HtpX [Oceanicella actignis]